jgi:hypothetical protein
MPQAAVAQGAISLEEMREIVNIQKTALFRHLLNIVAGNPEEGGGVFHSLGIDIAGKGYIFLLFELGGKVAGIDVEFICQEIQGQRFLQVKVDSINDIPYQGGKIAEREFLDQGTITARHLFGKTGESANSGYGFNTAGKIIGQGVDVGGVDIAVFHRFPDRRIKYDEAVPHIAYPVSRAVPPLILWYLIPMII